MMAAFSRSKKPMRPISFDSEIAAPGSSLRMISAARSSIVEFMGEKIDEIATDRSPFVLNPRAASATAPSSRGAISRPSNSWPPSTICTLSPNVAASSVGQSVKGGRPHAAGSARRTTPTGKSRLRSTKAFVKWVVPIITASMADTVVPESASTISSALTIPPMTSGVVGVLPVARTLIPSIRAASVLVPPTSIPIRMF